MISYFVTSTSLLFNSSTSPLTSLILLSYSWSFNPFASANSSTFFFISLCLDRSSSSCFDANNSSFSSARILSLFSSDPLLNCWTYGVFEGRKIRLTIRFHVSSIYKKNTQALYALHHGIFKQLRRRGYRQRSRENGSRNVTLSSRPWTHPKRTVEKSRNRLKLTCPRISTHTNTTLFFSRITLTLGTVYNDRSNKSRPQRVWT